MSVTLLRPLASAVKTQAGYLAKNSTIVNQGTHKIATRRLSKPIPELSLDKLKNRVAVLENQSKETNNKPASILKPDYGSQRVEHKAIRNKIHRMSSHIFEDLKYIGKVIGATAGGMLVGKVLADIITDGEF